MRGGLLALNRGRHRRFHIRGILKRAIRRLTGMFEVSCRHANLLGLNDCRKLVVSRTPRKTTGNRKVEIAEVFHLAFLTDNTQNLQVV